jgi:hypothetical protein
MPKTETPNAIPKQSKDENYDENSCENGNN